MFVLKTRTNASSAKVNLKFKEAPQLLKGQNSSVINARPSTGLQLFLQL